MYLLNMTKFLMKDPERLEENIVNMALNISKAKKGWQALKYTYADIRPVPSID